VLSPVHRSNRLLLAASFALFAGAGATTATGDALVPTALATGLAVGGVYAIAHYANRVRRRALAQLALGLWLGFLGIAGLHLIGAGTLAAVAPGSTMALEHSLIAVTWASLLPACASTAFLGFREYARTEADIAEEQLVESETSSDYSTR
jgi:hypothetical protein